MLGCAPSAALRLLVVGCVGTLFAVQLVAAAEAGSCASEGGCGSVEDVGGTEDCTRPIASCGGTETMCWEKKSWDDLTSCQQTAWSSLGYTRSLWDSGEIPADASLKWCQLSSSQRNDMCTVGYDEKAWIRSNAAGHSSGSGGGARVSALVLLLPAGSLFAILSR